MQVKSPEFSPRGNLRQSRFSCPETLISAPYLDSLSTRLWRLGIPNPRLDCRYQVKVKSLPIPRHSHDSPSWSSQLRSCRGSMSKEMPSVLVLPLATQDGRPLDGPKSSGTGSWARGAVATLPRLHSFTRGGPLTQIVKPALLKTLQ